MAPLISVLLLSIVSLFAQTMQQTAPQGSMGSFETAERITLNAALIAAVIVLWRSSREKEKDSRAELREKDERFIELTAKVEERLSAKDKALTELTANVVQALTATTESNKELRHVIETSVKTKQELAEALRGVQMELSLRPCLTKDE